VHPSWRDLVIDRLVGDDRGRRAFLERCGVDGAILAISVAGGRHGERALPLLRADADWDALTGRLREALRDGEERDVTRLLDALAATSTAGLDGEPRGELAALAGVCLERVRARGRDPDLPPVVLESWLRLAAVQDKPPAIPDLAHRWSELLPPDPVVWDEPAERQQAEDWLGFALLLSETAPQALRHLGFPDHYAAQLGRLREEAIRHDEPEVLERVRRLDPDVVLRPDPGLRLEWADHRPLDGPGVADDALVARVLADL
jgi:hypothetical protein